MGIGSWIIVGLIAGALAQRVVGAGSRGCLFTIVIGILGGLIGGFLFTAAGGDGVDELSLYSVFVAFIGACLLLLVFARPGRR